MNLMDEPIFESSGNIFTDLDFDPAEAAILHMRAKLMSDLRQHIQSSGMTQTEAAQKLGIAQSRVSDLMRGKWEKFSLEMLITLESRMGRSVTLELAA
jgi:predicted XRE-type DNA-binding protein